MSARRPAAVLGTAIFSAVRRRAAAGAMFSDGGTPAAAADSAAGGGRAAGNGVKSAGGMADDRDEPVSGGVMHATCPAVPATQPDVPTTNAVAPATESVGPATNAVALATESAGPATGAMATAVAGIVPRVNVAVRPATLVDVAFIDRLQKAHSRELGFLPTKAIEGKIKLNQVLIAEIRGLGASGLGLGEDAGASAFSPSPKPEAPVPTPVGYLIAADRYSHRDEVGYVTQINVLPEFRRHLVAAALLQAQFDRSAYGCRLYSAWCAQDLKANEFWEAMGFVPIAFRTGSRTKGKDKTPRMHIFWQKRVRADDTTTAWWYPAQTVGGEMREDRLVFPIPPGTGWRDVLPVVLPETANAAIDAVDDATALPGHNGGRTSPAKALPAPAVVKKPVVVKRIAAIKPPNIRRGMMWFAQPEFYEQPAADDPVALKLAQDEADREAAAEAKALLKQQKADARAALKAAGKKVDPRLTAMARELRDRWAEQNLAQIAPPARHDVRRLTDATTARRPAMPTVTTVEQRALPLAA